MGFWTKKIIETKVLYKTVHNKFNVGDTIYMLAYSDVFKTKIKEVCIDINEDQVRIYYTLETSPYGSSGKVRGFLQHELFASRQDIANNILLQL